MKTSRVIVAKVLAELRLKLSHQVGKRRLRTKMMMMKIRVKIEKNPENILRRKKNRTKEKRRDKAESGRKRKLGLKMTMTKKRKKAETTNQEGQDVGLSRKAGEVELRMITVLKTIKVKEMMTTVHRNS